MLLLVVMLLTVTDVSSTWWWFSVRFRLHRMWLGGGMATLEHGFAIFDYFALPNVPMPTWEFRGGLGRIRPNKFWGRWWEFQAFPFGGVTVWSVRVPIWGVASLVLVPACRALWLGRRRSGRCDECGYNLTGNVSGRCPECGQPVANLQIRN